MLVPAVIQLIVVLVLVAIGWLLPTAAPANTHFGVRIPPERNTTTLALAWRRTYRIGVLAFGVVGTVIAVWAAADRLRVLAVLSTVALVLAYYLLYYLAHRALQAGKADEQDRYAAPRPAPATGTAGYPWAWLLPALIVIASTTAYGVLRYPDLPERLALQYGADGQPDTLTNTGVLSAFAPVLAQLVLTVLIAGLAALPARLPTPVEITSPMREAESGSSFAAGFSRALLLLAALADLGLFFVAQQIWRGGSPGIATILAATLTAVGVLAVAGAAAYSGGAARRSTPPAGTDSRRMLDDNQHWPGGLFYRNPDDPALLVPKRFGIGWTLNFGHRWAWVVFVALLALPLIGAVLGILAG